MVPKPIQKQSWMGVWRPLWSHPWNKVLPRLHFWWFWLHFGTPFGTSLCSCRAFFLYMFFWSGFLMALASIWAPKTLPKWYPKGGQNQKLKFIDFASIYYTLATFRGPNNHQFWTFFGTLFKMPFRNLFLIDFAPFWGPSWDPLGTQKRP